MKQQLLSWEIRNLLAMGGPAPTNDVKFDGWCEKLAQSGFHTASLAGSPWPRCPCCSACSPMPAHRFSLAPHLGDIVPLTVVCQFSCHGKAKSSVVLHL